MISSKDSRILDFCCQLKWPNIEAKPVEFLEHLTQTPFFASLIVNWTYSIKKGFVENENPIALSFSKVIILHVK